MASPRLLAVLAAAALALAACDRLPDASRQHAEQVRQQALAAPGLVRGERGNLDRVLDGPDGAFLRPYAEREGWRDAVAAAERRATALAADWEAAVKPVLAKDASADAAPLKGRLDAMARDAAAAVSEARAPFDRARALLDGRAAAGPAASAAAAEVAAAVSAGHALRSRLEAAAAAYPAKADALTARYAAYVDKLVAAEGAAKAASAEAGRSQLPDYVAALASAQRATDQVAEAGKMANDALVAAGELGHFWSRTLIDMKEECSVRLGLSSWNEYSDYGERESVSQWLSLPCADADLLDDLADNTTLVSRGTSGRADYHSTAVATILGRLGYTPGFALLGADHNSAEVWLEDVAARYFHRYAEMYDGQSRETDWIAVDAKTYEDNENNLFMDLTAKPEGAFEADAYRQPTPRGLAFVGSLRCGRWVPNDAANIAAAMVWQWASNCDGYYAGAGFDRYVYTNHDYDTWRRDHAGRSAFYGSGPDGAPRWGTEGSEVRGSAAAQRTAFAKHGGFHEAAASARAAGPDGRGGGPGGAGK